MRLLSALRRLFAKDEAERDRTHLQNPFFQEALFRALLSNTAERPGLPPELVQIIFSHANLSRPLRLYHLRKRENVSISGLDSSVKSAIVLATPPISLRQGAPAAADSRRLAPCLRIGRHNWLRVQTVSKDQGWCTQPDAGCWSWFEVGIGRLTGLGVGIMPRSDDSIGAAQNEARHEVEETEPEEGPIDDISIRMDPTDETRELVWRSHGNPIGVDIMAERTGDEFGPDHKIWDLLQDGDVVFVRACAQFGGWRNYVKRARMEWKVDFESCL